MHWLGNKIDLTIMIAVLRSQLLCLYRNFEYFLLTITCVGMVVWNIVIYIVVHVCTLCQPVMSFLVCELCEPVATSSHFYISDFCEWNFCLCSFFCILYYAVPPTCICSLCVILAHALMNGIHQLVHVHAAPTAFLQKRARVKSQLCSKWSLKCTFPENF